MRSRRIVRRIDLRTVLKVSLAFYLCVLVVALVAGAVLWNLAAAFGVLKTFDKLVRSLFALSSFRLRPLPALGWGMAVGVVLSLIGTLLNVLAALLYNLISDVVGGVQVSVVGEDKPAASPQSPSASPQSPSASPRSPSASPQSASASPSMPTQRVRGPSRTPP